MIISAANGLLSPAEIPQRLIRQLLELDADYAEALWALDQPPGSFNVKAIVRDTPAALGQLPAAIARFCQNLAARAHPRLEKLEASVREKLSPKEGHDAAISPDGRFVAFRADRDGPFDVWLSQVGTGRFVNLTQGKDDEPRAPWVRSMGFSGDGSEIWLKARSTARLTKLTCVTVGNIDCGSCR